MTTHPLIGPRVPGRQGSLLRNFSDFQRSLDDLFEDVLRPAARTSGGLAARGDWVPAIDTEVGDDALFVRLDLPGVAPEDVDVSLEGERLHIAGERKAPERQSGSVREIVYGRFERTLTVPEGIEPESVTASYDHGVLEIRLPKPKQAVPHKVAVQATNGSTPKS